MTLAVRAVFWVLAYLGVAIAPLVFAVIGARQPGYGFWSEFSVALAFVGLAMMGLEFALVARFDFVAAAFGQDALLQFHRQIGFVGLAFVLGHVALSTQWHAVITSAAFRAPAFVYFGAGAAAAVVVLVVTSVWRKPLRLSYEVWHVVHTVLAVVAVVGSLVHIYLIHQYLNSVWKQVLWGLMSLAFLALLAWVRVLKPRVMHAKPWVLAKVGRERGQTTTLTLRPPPGVSFRFAPGQFAWFSFGRSPHALTMHPFSFSSSASLGSGRSNGSSGSNGSNGSGRSNGSGGSNGSAGSNGSGRSNGSAGPVGEVEIAVRALGDFTSRAGDLKPGALVYVDGPHGVFSMDFDEGPGFCFIGGGVGITGLLSMLRTMADRRDPRPAFLFYANRDWESVAFRDTLSRLPARMDLTVVHVLQRPPADWAGETGYVNAEMLAKHLPASYRRLQYFICGPGPMMDAVENALLKLGVPAERVHTERFDMV